MIFLFLLTSGISVYFLAIESQTSMIEAQGVINTLQTKKAQENYAVSISTDSQDYNRLAIQIKNQGHFPLEIADFWIINKTDAINQFPVTRYDVNFTEPYIPPGYGTDILEDYPLYMIPDTYNVKVVSTLGTIHQQELVVGGPNNLRADLFAIPADIKVGQNATIALHVTNIGNTRLTNVQPSPITITPSTGVSPPLPPLPSAITLDPAESMIFSWNYEVTGTVGNNVNFSTNVTATEDITGFNFTSNNTFDEITLREPDAIETIVLTQDLISRPEIFMIIPAPFGSQESSFTPEKGLWGANVVNPTANPMNVTKLVISLLSPRGDANDKMFNAQPGFVYCDPIAVGPTVTTEWSCPANNQLMWSSGTPITIQPFSVHPFLAKVKAGSVSGTDDDLDSVIVHGSVFTNVGEFGKAGYSSSARNTPGSSIANVFLSTEEALVGDNNIIANITGIQPLEVVTFNATLADYELTNIPTSSIEAGTDLIINIPKGWTVDQSSIDGFSDFTTSYITLPDSSSQITGDLISNLSGAGNVGASIQFNATAPDVSTTQMYVMYILANGNTTASGEPDFAVSALSEVILQVTP